MSDLGATTISREDTPFGNGDTEPEVPNVKSSPVTNKIIRELTKTYAIAGVGLVGFGNVSGKESLRSDGMMIVSQAEELAESWRYLLDHDAKVRRTLSKLIETGGWTAVIMAHGALLFGIVKENHPNVASGFTRRVRQRQTAPAS